MNIFILFPIISLQISSPKFIMPHEDAALPKYTYIPHLLSKQLDLIVS